MVLPLLFSIGLPALAGTGALGATLGAMSVPALAGIGAARIICTDRRHR